LALLGQPKKIRAWNSQASVTFALPRQALALLLLIEQT